jgi:hypothetical protein
MFALERDIPDANTSYRLHYHFPRASSKSSVSRRPLGQDSYDLMSLLTIASTRSVGLSANTWQPLLGQVGKGATANIHQSFLNVKTSLAFKCPTASTTSSNEISQEFISVMSEIDVLSHSDLRLHPNIISLEGICWDFRAGTGDAWPVFIFEKAHRGDLCTFLNSEEGKCLKTEERLHLCSDIALALTTLHRAGEFSLYSLIYS